MSAKTPRSEIEQRWYGPAEAATLLGVSVRTVYRLRGEMPPRRRVGGRLKWDVRQLDAYAAGRRWRRPA